MFDVIKFVTFANKGTRMPNYGDPKYWNKRYKEQAKTMFDW
jgi:hypothetical protein